MREQSPPPATPYARALAQSADFMLPLNWRHGLEAREAVAADPIGAIPEDAISWERGNNGEHIVTLSVANPGSFLYDDPDFLKRVMRWSRNTAKHGSGSPLPPGSLNKDALSVVGEEGRPALSIHLPIDENGLGEPSVSRNVLYAQQISSRSIGDILQDPSHRHHTMLAGAQQALSLFRTARLRRMGKTIPEWFILDNEGLAYEAVLAGACGIARFALRHNIPCIYINSGIPADLRPDISDPEDRQSILSPFIQGWLSPYNPIGVSNLGVDTMAVFSRSLRDRVSFANNCNVSAFLDGATHMPFPPSRMEQLARYENTHRAIGQDAVFVKKTLDGWGPSALPARAAQALLGEGGDSPSPALLTKALFETYGSPDEMQALQERVGRVIRMQPFLARKVIQLAIARGHIESSAAALELVSREYHGPAMSTNSTQKLDGQLRLLGEAADLPELKGAIDEQVAARAEARAEAAARQTALAEARVAFYALKVSRGLGEAGYATAPGSIPPELPKAMQNWHDPLQLLYSRQDAGGGKMPIYTFAEDNNDCLVSVRDADGELYTGFGSARRRRAAQRLAAADVLAKMQERSYGKTFDECRAADAAAQAATTAACDRTNDP